MSNFGTYQNNTDFWSAVGEWRMGLDDNRGQRAELRRAKTPVEILCSPAYQRGFVTHLASKGFPLDADDIERLAPAAGLLAHVTVFSGKSHFARQLAASNKGSQDVRDQRFKKLMAIEDRDELYLMLMRLIRYLDGSAHVNSLVRSVFYWGDTVKRNWALNYYTA
ncbi:type I-E CRISPR-associated protein Cse2/CasB [Oceanidesulfovibrio marinus]|uniref:Type I-E CRISPR-associated protein Cse2/CasB n=1 Tax=Oceanidesulfovibrio marinus TaxID=370038 RepID=A0ABX6NBQ0_9BACT|nr:type I-E CRISPR-associated protein Cse2/CasB [Oceanidesulfovibrio marinus]QJT08017.1 type I-E CRISPR-associated protein Cse2/CasB [Oceanidesulfovibrio marinus]